MVDAWIPHAREIEALLSAKLATPVGLFVGGVLIVLCAVMLLRLSV